MRGGGGGGGERGSQADVGTCELCISKFLYFPTCGDFFLKSTVFGEAKHPTGFEDALQGRVVRKPVNANPGLKVNWGNNFSSIKTFPPLMFCVV